MKLRSIMLVGKIGLVGLSFMIGIVGCAPRDPITGEAIITATPERASMTKQINVQKLTPIFAVKFDRGSGEISDMQKGRILGFIQAQNTNFGDTLKVELPPFTDASGVNEARYGSIGTFLQDEGFHVEPKILADGLTNSLRVYFTKYVATIDPECAKGWQKPEGQSFENLQLSHMGCSTSSALAQMVANPKDLIDPQTMGGYDGERAAVAIKKYRVGSGGAKKSGGSEKSK